MPKDILANLRKRSKAPGPEHARRMALKHEDPETFHAAGGEIVQHKKILPSPLSFKGRKKIPYKRKIDQLLLKNKRKLHQ